MKQIVLFLAIAGLYVAATNAEHKVVCYYDFASDLREGVGRLTSKQLEEALPYCSHLVYGYMIMYGDNYQIHSYGEVDEKDVLQHYFAEIKSFKQKYPELKILLSVGGDRDIDVSYPRKYIELLEATQEKQKKFIESALWLVKHYGFDGLDLAYQFPRNKPRKIHGALGSFVKSFKKIFTGNEVVDPDAETHKQQFTRLVSDLQDKLHPDGYLLSLTVLPNVNSTWYFDIPKLDKLVDFVNLGTFDFYTPERNPEEADYSAPLFYDNSEDRLPHNNVKFQTEYWNNQGFPAKKINVGIPTHGNVWQLTDDSGNTGIPIVHHTAGPAPPSPLTNKHGLLSAPEICKLLTLPGIDVKMDKEAHVTHSTLGHYGYLPAEGKSRGLWVGYDDIDTVTKKAEFALVYAGGVALFHLGHDDYLGVCAKVSYPILRSIKQTFLDTMNVKFI
ncbi:hypothetical protein KR215_002159 [Drosophila sulfurigaster]|nr:hypothetical protein KR215_002159 [Drosophila sulfurigaster]